MARASVASKKTLTQDPTLRVASDLYIIYEVASLIASGFRAFVSDPAAQTHHGATPAQLRLLQLVAMWPGITVTEAANSLAITSASASTALGRLHSTGWVNRHPDPNDARCAHFELSRPGKKTLAEFERIQAERIKALLARFSKKDIALFRTLIGRATERIEDMYGQA